MKKLKELFEVVKQYRARKIELPGMPSGTKKTTTKLEHFYTLLNKEEIDDDAAARHLGYEGKKTGNYRRLKSQMEKQLLNTLFFLDLTHFSDDKAARIKCLKYWFAAKILLYIVGSRYATSRLAKKVLQEAQKYDFEDIAMDVCYFMRRYYGIMEKNEKLFEYYNTLYYQYKGEREIKEFF